jgi:hypothetical protein
MAKVNEIFDEIGVFSTKFVIYASDLTKFEGECMKY